MIAGIINADPSGVNNAGRVLVFYGTNYTTQINNVLTYANITLSNTVASENFGSSVGSCDVNGDGYEDILAGAYYASPAGVSNAGQAYVFFGSDYTIFSENIRNFANITINATGASDYLGQYHSSIGCGDFNNDSYYDFIVGATDADYGGSTNKGKAYLFLGSDYQSIINLRDTDANITVIGSSQSDELGNGFAVKDVNNDGYPEVVIAASWARCAGVSPTGQVTVYEYTTLPPNFEPIYDFTKDEDFSQFTINLQDNVSDAEDSDSSLTYNWTVNDTNVLTLDIINTMGIATFTSVANSSGSALITISVVDTLGSSNSTQFVITVNAINDPPCVDLDKPDNGTTNSTSNVIDFTFTPNDTDSTIDNCTLVINNTANTTSMSITSGSINNITVYLPNGDYDWNVNCTDDSNLVGASATRSLTVSKSDDEDEDEDEDEDDQGEDFDNGGLYVDIDNSIEDVPLQTDDRLSVVIGDVEHTVLVTDLTPHQITFEIDPYGITVIVDKDGVEQVDIDGDGVYDLEITVGEIDSDRKTAAVSVRQISAPIAQPPEETPTQELPEEEAPAGEVVYTPSASDFIRNNLFKLVIAFIIIVSGAFFVIRKFYFKGSKPRTRKR